MMIKEPNELLVKLKKEHERGFITNEEAKNKLLSIISNIHPMEIHLIFKHISIYPVDLYRL